MTTNTPGPVKLANGFIVGTIVRHVDGFRFLPGTPAHKPSRKAYATPDECVPLWARRMLKESMQ